MYSPKISEDLVRELYKMKHSTADRTPMTKLVNEAITEYLERIQNKYEQKETNENSSEDNGNNY